MITSPAVETRLALPGDVEQIAVLLPALAGPEFPQRFPGSTAADFCSWKYFSNPLGPAAVGIAITEGRVVSLVAGVPKLMSFGSQTALAFELGDFITAPDFRKRGLFSTLIRMICDQARDRQAAFAYVRPNEQSFRVLTKDLLFREIQKIDERRYLLPSTVVERKTGIPAMIPRALGMDWLVHRMLLPRASSNVQVEAVARFDASVDEWWASTGHKFAWSIARNHGYLNWRYVDCPTPYRSFAGRRNGRFAGYVTIFLPERGGTGYILDLVSDPEDPETAGALLARGVNEMLDRGASAIYTWTLHSGASSAGRALLEGACPWKAGAPLHVAARFMEDHSSVLAQGPWQLNLGDFDGI